MKNMANMLGFAILGGVLGALSLGAVNGVIDAIWFELHGEDYTEGLCKGFAKGSNEGWFAGIGAGTMYSLMRR